eukprot:1396629-Rhodomonas_salina.1
MCIRDRCSGTLFARVPPQKRDRRSPGTNLPRSATRCPAIATLEPETQLYFMVVVEGDKPLLTAINLGINKDQGFSFDFAVRDMQCPVLTWGKVDQLGNVRYWPMVLQLCELCYGIPVLSRISYEPRGTDAAYVTTRMGNRSPVRQRGMILSSQVSLLDMLAPRNHIQENALLVQSAEIAVSRVGFRVYARAMRCPVVTWSMGIYLLWYSHSVRWYPPTRALRADAAFATTRLYCVAAIHSGEVRYIPTRYRPNRYLPTRYVPNRYLPKRYLPTCYLPSHYPPTRYLPTCVLMTYAPDGSAFQGAGTDIAYGWCVSGRDHGAGDRCGHAAGVRNQKQKPGTIAAPIARDVRVLASDCRRKLTDDRVTLTDCPEVMTLIEMMDPYCEIEYESADNREIKCKHPHFRYKVAENAFETG